MAKDIADCAVSTIIIICTFIRIVVPVGSDEAVAVAHRRAAVLLRGHQRVRPLGIRDVVVLVHRSEPLVGEDGCDLQQVGRLLPLELDLLPFDGEVPVGQRHGWVDGAQRRFEGIRKGEMTSEKSGAC